MDIHIVRDGDTIDSVAAQYGITVERLLRDNGQIKTANLVQGQTLVITYPSRTHIVQDGDTLAGIAEEYGITLMQLLQYNAFLAERDFIFPGETLVINYTTEATMATHGFIYPHINRKILSKTLPLLSFLSIYNYRVTEDNKIITYGEDADLIKLSIEYGTIPILMISSITPKGQPNLELIYEILLNQEYQEKVVLEIIRLVKTHGYKGLNIMVSSINTTNQHLYLKLFENYNRRLKAEGLYFFITINLNVEDKGTDTSRDKLDYSTIEQLVDGIVFLQYYGGTNPGAPKPVNDVNRIKKYIDYVIRLMPPEKVIIGLTLIGYDWELPYRSNSTKASTLSLDSVIVLAQSVETEIQLDEVSLTPYYNYKVFYPGGSVDHIVWFINATSIEALLDVNYEMNILGSGIWGIMVFNQQLWALICSRFKIIKYLPDHLS